MEEYKCKTIVFSSSATVYGNPNDELLKESSRINPINTYGETKFTVENLLKNIYQTKTDERNIAILRYFNPIGAHDSGLIGENPLDKPNNIFPLIRFTRFKSYTRVWNDRRTTSLSKNISRICNTLLVQGIYF